MSNIVPLTPTTPDQLVSRHVPAAPVGTVMPAPQGAMTLSEVERVCNMIASGGDLVPPAYRGKPGAVLLAKLWADANGVDLFTAVQNISPIEGKPFVSAEMRVALAVARGFEFRVTESTREVCTVEVWLIGERRGAITARIDDQPRKLQYTTGKATPWKTHPDDMLFAEACRKADRRYVKTAAALLDAGQDYTVESDPIDVLEQVDAEGPPAAPSGPVAGAEPDIASEPSDASIAERETFLLSAATAAGMKRPRIDLLKLAQQLGHQVGTIDALVADGAAYDAVLDHLQDTGPAA